MIKKRTHRIYFSNLISSLIIKLFEHKVKNCNNRLLVVNTEKLGDLVLTADFLSALRIKNEFSSYYLILDEQYSQLFDTEKLGYIIIPFDKKSYRFNLFYRIKFIKFIRQAAFSKVMNIAPERGMINEEIVLTSGAHQKIALKDTSLYLNKSSLSRNNKKYNFIYHSEELNLYKRMMAYAGGVEINSNILYLTIPRNDEKYIVIAPMASEIKRTWGNNNYKELIKRFEQKVILLGSGKERESLNELMGDRKNILNLAGKVNLNEAAGIIKNARLFIGNDSGLTHIALYLNVPLIAIIGGGKYNIFFPYKESNKTVFLYNKMDCFGCSWFCKHKTMKCLDVSVDEVVNASVRFL